MSILSVDSNVLMQIVDNLEGKDLINLCKTSNKFRRFCNQYSDIIWKNKLSQEYGIQEMDIIGNPRSYYIGLSENKGFWYFYDFFDGLRLEFVGREELDGDSCFMVPGKDPLENEKIIWVNVNIHVRNYGNEDLNFVGKRTEIVLEQIIKKLGTDSLISLDPDLILEPLLEEIKQLKPDSDYQTDVTVMLGWGDIPTPGRLTIHLRELVLSSN